MELKLPQILSFGLFFVGPLPLFSEKLSRVNLSLFHKRSIAGHYALHCDIRIIKQLIFLLQCSLTISTIFSVVLPVQGVFLDMVDKGT